MQIKDKDRKRLFEILDSTPQIHEVWAYGSRVKGTAREGSDIDLVLKTNDGKKLSFTYYSALIDKIRNSSIPVLVDIFDWARLSDSFKTEISKQYEVFYLRDRQNVDSSSNLGSQVSK